jgi:hypothetical protein
MDMGTKSDFELARKPPAHAWSHKNRDDIKARDKLFSGLITDHPD